MPVLRALLSVIAGFAAGLAVTWVAGESPWNVFMILIRSAFGSWYDLGMTLFYTTPLLLTGLSVAICFQAGLFNIGAEGQLTLGALAAAVTGVVLAGLPWPLAPVAAAAAAFGTGAFWGWIAGWLRARRGSHEVITTIMLNFVAAGLSSYVALYLFPNPDSQNPETRPVAKSFLIQHLSVFGDAPVSTALILAVAMCVAYGFLMRRTVLGFELRSVGQSERAARVAGIDPGKIQILAMVLAGGLAGLVGVGEVLGNAEKFKLGFSPQYGFVGIAVALLGRGNPVGVAAAALLFGALHKGTGDLDFETENVTRDLSMILQALVILSVSADGLWDWVKRRV
ncbi:MAG: ABC transporter permease [Bdellovibrionales bacterium]|nr:ABC transporter permease [Bdellovibrionales bacterium]